MNRLQQAFFLDRDGIINERRADDYVKSRDEFTFLPDIFGVLPRIHAKGALAIVITNQRGIGRGLMSEEDLDRIHRGMQGEILRRTGHMFDGIYHCPHDLPDRCDCRKPMPGMLLKAASDHHIDLGRSWMIGDSPSDIAAGIAAGCHTAFVSEEAAIAEADIVADTLAEAWERIVAVTRDSEP